MATLANVGPLPSVYALFLVFTYTARKFTQLLRLDEDKTGKWANLERLGLTAVLLVGIAYILYVLIAIGKKKLNSTSPTSIAVAENDTSHISGFSIAGSIVFGLGSVMYYSLELTTYVTYAPQDGLHWPIHHILKIVNSCLCILFCMAQTYLILGYPRMNLIKWPKLNSFGIKHLVALNLILLVKTLVKESVHEALYLKKYYPEEVRNSTMEQYLNDLNKIYGNQGMNNRKSFAFTDDPSLPNRTSCNEKCYDSCPIAPCSTMATARERFNCGVNEFAYKNEAIFYALMIEFAMIGLGCAWLMAKHVGRNTEVTKEFGSFESFEMVKKIKGYLMKKHSWQHFWIGAACGIAFFISIIVQLNVDFVNLDANTGGDPCLKKENEYYIKLSNIITFLMGMFASVMGFSEIKKLETEESTDAGPNPSEDLDKLQLRVTMTAQIIFQTFIILMGFQLKDAGIGLVALACGVLAIVQVVLQAIFVETLQKKVLKEESIENNERPGRQIVVFLILFNMGVWFIDTFKYQKMTSYPLEMNFYGMIPWLIIVRMTMPIVATFRFHSSILLFECFKEIYKPHQDKETNKPE